VMTKGIAYTQAGSGIVYDSVPEREYEESLNKAQALLKAITQAQSSELTPRRSHAVAD
jgi:anthranilate synthase component 1